MKKTHFWILTLAVLSSLTFSPLTTFAQNIPSKVLEGHTGSVNSIAFSPDGSKLASGSDDGTIRLWDAATGEHLLTLEGHTDDVWSIAFSPDGNRLASRSRDRTIRLWDAATGEHLLTLEGHTDDVNSIAFSPDGNRLAGGSNNNTIYLWDAATGKHLLTLEGHTDDVNSIAFSPDGSRLASGSLDNTIRLWDAATGEHLLTLTGHTDYVWSIAFSPDGSRLASGSLDNTIRLWDAATGEHLSTLTGHTDYVWSIAFSPNGNRLASGSWDNTIRLWDAATGEHLSMLTGHTDFVNSVAFSPDGSKLASGSDDGTIRLWDAATGEHLSTLTGHTDYVNSIAFSPDGSRLVSMSSDGTIRLWELPNKLPNRISLIPTPVVSPAIGEQFTISVSIVAGENVGGYQVSLSFDPTALRYVDSANGDYLSPGAFFVPPVISENKITLGGSALAGESNGNGTLATVIFEVIDVKESVIDLLDIILTDSAGEHLPQLFLNSTKIVEPVPLPSSAVISLTPSSVLSPAIGEQLTFNIDIAGGQNVKDFALTLDFDRSALKYVSRNPGDYLANGVGNGDGTLETVIFEVLAVKASTISLSGYLIATNELLYGSTFENAEVVAPLFGDVNRDGVVNIQDLVLVGSSFTRRVTEGGNPADVNEDGVVNIVDLVKVAGAINDGAAAPSTWNLETDGTITRDQVQKWLSEARQLSLTDVMSQQGILFLEQLLEALTPEETRLLANYPNPFNPETWIPYQLAKSAAVTLTIYDTRGVIVRKLSLGHQTAGYYNTRNNAAHWDGKNALGESVASGIYFYTLTAGDFTATRKMLIKK